LGWMTSKRMLPVFAMRSGDPLIHGDRIRCCIRDCQHWLAKRHRGASDPAVCCPDHGISVSASPTYNLRPQDYRCRFLVDVPVLGRVNGLKGRIPAAWQREERRRLELERLRRHSAIRRAERRIPATDRPRGRGRTRTLSLGRSRSRMGSLASGRGCVRCVSPWRRAPSNHDAGVAGRSTQRNLGSGGLTRGPRADPIDRRHQLHRRDRLCQELGARPARCAGNVRRGMPADDDHG